MDYFVLVSWLALVGTQIQENRYSKKLSKPSQRVTFLSQNVEKDLKGDTPVVYNACCFAVVFHRVLLSRNCDSSPKELYLYRIPKLSARQIEKKGFSAKKTMFDGTHGFLDLSDPSDPPGSWAEVMSSCTKQSHWQLAAALIEDLRGQGEGPRV